MFFIIFFDFCFCIFQGSVSFYERVPQLLPYLESSPRIANHPILVPETSTQTNTSASAIFPETSTQINTSASTISPETSNQINSASTISPPFNNTELKIFPKTPIHRRPSILSPPHSPHLPPFTDFISVVPQSSRVINNDYFMSPLSPILRRRNSAIVNAYSANYGLLAAPSTTDGVNICDVLLLF